MRPLLQLLLLFIVSLAAGLGSAWYMIEEGSAFTTARIGPWSVWHSAGKPDADPYTIAHMARAGRLPINATTALYFFAGTDNEGLPLRAQCEYVVEGRPINAAWWSIALYDGTGRLIPNKAERHSFNRTDIARRADGSFRIVLARTARPGNWLPSADDGTLKLVLRAYGVRHADGIAADAAVVFPNLPSIRKVLCR